MACGGSEPDESGWAYAVDEASAWWQAVEAVEVINRAAAVLGMDGDGVRAVVAVGRCGEPVVLFPPEGAHVIGVLLGLVAEEAGGRWGGRDRDDGEGGR